MAAAFVAVVVQGGHVASAAEDEIVLGTTLPLTGAYQHIGEDTKNGYELAIYQINKRGGVVVGDNSFRLVARYYNDNSNPVRAQELIDRLIDRDGVKFVLGPYHAHRYPGVLTTVERNRVPTVAGHSVARKRVESGSNFSFAVTAMPDRYFTPTLEFVKALSERFGKSSQDLRIGMATENDPFSREVRAGVLSDVRRLGIACIIDDQLPESFDDMSATLDRVKTLKPDVFLVSGHEAIVASAVNQIEESGASVPLVAVTHCETARLAKESPKSSNYVFCPVQWDRSAPHEGELFGTAEQFAVQYEGAYGREPSSVAAQAAAAVYVFADAFTRAQSFEPEEVRDAISATNLQTFFGPIKFDALGINSKKSGLLTQIIDGDYVLIAPQGWAEQEPVIRKQAP
ncbi:MAG: amino acid ABC transporter substrate-binding protein [Methyloceanibacter sp.]|nr:amino acid ABC transporter substrate-binding protein [Methyloceanibacter sp.]